MWNLVLYNIYYFVLFYFVTLGRENNGRLHISMLHKLTNYEQEDTSPENLESKYLNHIKSIKFVKTCLMKRQTSSRKEEKMLWNILCSWNTILCKSGIFLSSWLHFDYFCPFQTCQNLNGPLCTARVKTKVTISGTCNMFGIFRKGRRAQMDHPQCREE